MITLPDLNVPELQKQQAGVDLTLDKIFSFSSLGSVDYDNSERKISETKEIEFENDWVELKPGTYKVVLRETVKIPKDCLGIGLPRSTLLRCGATIHTAFWDPGYEGKSEVMLVVHNEKGIKLKKQARIMQMTFAKVENAQGTYSGQYQKENL
ncbi:deoxyuridine 5'-triphosphate nucleotidohydrolase [Candidatus Micrarchaeota archaeon]|jgi:dUTP pyrophosphatase|nr:deoxyuridine 5'-triphosphate nucleotidohydrolase [Candidatus Micrarchaeota archaeon]